MGNKKKKIRICDLPEEANINEFAVRLPKHIYRSSSLPIYGIKNVPVYLQGFVMGDFFVKIKKESTQIYPMFWGFIPEGIENWEVVETTLK